MPKVTDEKIRFYSTDINLGHEGVNYLSENHQEYVEYPLERKMTKEERMDTLRDLRGTHFKLGNDGTDDRYRSMAQDVFFFSFLYYFSGVLLLKEQIQKH